MNAGCYINSRNVARYGCSTGLTAHTRLISDHNITISLPSQCLVLSASVADALRPGARLYLLRSMPAHQRPAQGRSDPPEDPGGFAPKGNPSPWVVSAAPHSFSRLDLCDD